MNRLASFKLSPALAIFVLALLMYTMLAAPGITWMDSGELAASAFGLGGAHPPGHPMHTLLGKLATLVPIGNVALRLTVLSGIGMAAAAAGVVALANALIPSERSAAIAAGGLVALSPLLQLNASRVEVYGLSTAFAVWAMVHTVHYLHAKPESGAGRHVLLAALFSGMGAAVHPPIAAASALPMVVAIAFSAHRILPGRARLLRIGSAALACGVLPLVAYAYLPVRANAATPPLLMWGDPADAHALWKLVTGASYQSNFTLHGGFGRFSELALLCGEGVGLAILLGGLVGLLVGAVTALRGATVVFAGAVSVITGASLQSAFNPDMPGYVAPALCFLAAGFAPLVGALLRMIPSAITEPGHRLRPLAAVALLLPLVAMGLAGSVAPNVDAGPRRGDGPLRRFHASVGRMPPGPGVYVARGDDGLFPAQYERFVAGARPDIVVVEAELLRDRWFGQVANRLVPEIYVPYADDGAVFPSMVRQMIVANLSRGRPVGGDEWRFRRGGPSPAAPLGPGYLLGIEPRQAAPAPPPPSYDGVLGGRIAGRIGLVRGMYEAARGRLDQAAVAAGLSGRFGPEEMQELATSIPSPDRPVLYSLIPRHHVTILFARWQAELFGDDLAWIAGLPPPKRPATIYERRVHRMWRDVLSGARAVNEITDRGFDADAFERLGRLLQTRNELASRRAFERARKLRPEHEPSRTP